MNLLSKQHRILERDSMEGRPFGVDAAGEKIRDVSGVVVKANIEYLEEVITRDSGAAAAQDAVEELARRLNDRIPEREYHVTPAFLRNPWNSYSYEFVIFLAEICGELSGDPDFSYHCGQKKFLPPLIQILGKPFSPAQVYKMFQWFGEKYAKGALVFQAPLVEEHRAVLRMQFNSRVARQFGPYLKASAWVVCQSAKAALSMVPVQVHNLKRPAIITDRSCIAEGHEWCEWEIQWTPEGPPVVAWALAGLFAGIMVFLGLWLGVSSIGAVAAAVTGSLAAVAIWTTGAVKDLVRRTKRREALVREELAHLEARHEELRETCADQSQMLVDLKRKVTHLSALHKSAVIFSSTLDRELLIDRALRAIKDELHYDRVILTFFDHTRHVCCDTRIVGVGPDVADQLRAAEVPVTDPTTMGGRVLLRGERLLIPNIQEVKEELHPITARFASLLETKAIISLPVHVRGTVLAALTVERGQEQSLSHEDLDLMSTVASQLGVALDNAEAYRRIEELNVGLEERIRERTKELLRANEELGAANAQLQTVDKQKDLFLMTVSHDLRNPLGAIKGFAENVLHGIAATPEKQAYYLTRIRDNADRLGRMIKLLLNVAEIKAGRMEMTFADVELSILVNEVVEQLSDLARLKEQQVLVHPPERPVIVQADVDKLTQVLCNLVENGIKYTPRHGTISIYVGATDQHASVHVADTGEGIPASELPKIFDPFYQVARRAEGRQHGIGLGLWIVKQLAELQSGTITVTSEVGKGTEFVVRLPLIEGR